MSFVFAVISAIVLFLYGLQAFTREIQAVGGETLRNGLGRLTRTPVRGVLLGAATTAIVQSSSAVVAPGHRACRFRNSDISFEPGRGPRRQRRDDVHRLADFDR